MTIKKDGNVVSIFIKWNTTSKELRHIADLLDKGESISLPLKAGYIPVELLICEG